eukprot:TRINITY_DN7490_c0_g1_i1.p1 TRINITY_DN7490_c0_g1~~TRINITY_DN7490_c0_g1_i1.p1  ORF type:complete len:435 (+),score=67.85 TRINITY_DN7490_c0_g1_i1:41-1345(+)
MYFTGNSISTFYTGYGQGLLWSSTYVIVPYYICIPYEDILFEDEDLGIQICKVKPTLGVELQIEPLLPSRVHYIFGDLERETVIEPSILNIYENDNTGTATILNNPELENTFLRSYILSRSVNFGDSGLILYCMSSNNRYAPISMVVAGDKENENLCYCLYLPLIFDLIGGGNVFIDGSGNYIEIFDTYVAETKNYLSKNNIKFISGSFGEIAIEVAKKFLTEKLDYDDIIPCKSKQVFELEIWKTLTEFDIDRYVTPIVNIDTFDRLVLEKIFKNVDDWKVVKLKIAFCVCKESGDFEDKCWVVPYEKIRSRDQPNAWFKKVAEFMREHKLLNIEDNTYYSGSTKPIKIEGLNIRDGNTACHHPLLCEKNLDCKGNIMRKNRKGEYTKNPIISHCCIKPSHLCTSSNILNKLGEILQNINNEGYITITVESII